MLFSCALVYWIYKFIFFIFYAAGIGASEALLSYTIGGISKLGGKLSGNIISKTLEGIDNGIARFALQYGGQIVSEGLEEGIQEILDPIFKSLASDTSVKNWGGIDWGNVAYSSLLGGLSSGVFELSSSISTNSQNNKLNPNEVIAGMWEDSPNSSKDIVEKSQLESVENVGESWYNDNNIITDGSHLSNGKLKPNVKYKSGEYDYIYATDGLGRISDLHTEELQYTERDERLKHNSNSPGKEIGDHAGHLIGDRYGGSPDIDNIVSQSGLVNLSEYKKIENTWARALDSGQKVGIDIKVQYEGNSMRPSSFIVNYTIDGIKTQTTIEN